MDPGGCCTDSGNGLVGYLTVKDARMGIVDLDWIIRKVREMELADEEMIKEELLQKVMARNYVPSSAREAYGDALLRYYKETARS